MAVVNINNGTLTGCDATKSSRIRLNSSLQRPVLNLNGGNWTYLGAARAQQTKSSFGVESINTLSVQTGASTFNQNRGSSARVIDTFSNITRSVGGTVRYRCQYALFSGSDNASSGGYRVSQATSRECVVPMYITYTTTESSSSPGTGLNGLPLTPNNPMAVSWFVPSTTSVNGTAYSAFTAATGTGLGSSTQNITVVGNVTLPGGGQTVNTLAFVSGGNSSTLTVNPGDTLTIAAGGILLSGAYGDHTRDSHHGRHHYWFRAGRQSAAADQATTLNDL